MKKFPSFFLRYPLHGAVVVVYESGLCLVLISQDGSSSGEVRCEVQIGRRQTKWDSDVPGPEVALERNQPPSSRLG